MNTTINNLALTQLLTLRKAQSAEGKKGAEAETTPLAEFNERVGMMPHHSKAPVQATLVSRNRTNQRRPLQETQMGTFPGSGDKDDDEELFSSGQMKLVGELRRGGEQAAKDWLSKKHDPLERHELLRYAINKSGDEGDKRAFSNLMDNLMKEHGGEIKSALKDADTLKTAVHKMGAMSNAEAGAGDSATLRGFRSLFSSTANNKLNEPSDALSLATRLQDRFGADHFASALKEMRSQLSSQMRTMNKGSELGPKMWLSMSDASNFRAIQSAHATAGDLRKDLSDAKITPRKKEGDATLALLGVPGLSPNMAGKLADDVVGRNDLSSQQRAHMYRLLAKAVGTLPTTLWSDDKQPQRLDLISELRNLSGSSANEAQKSRETKEAKLERMLREQVKRLKK